MLLYQKNIATALKSNEKCIKILYIRESCKNSNKMSLFVMLTLNSNDRLKI